MADETHLHFIKQGTEVWNQWRANNINIKPELTGADLGGANLGGANLSRADLREAALFGADLLDASLITADLIAANLRSANLSRADLSWANLRGADLYRADLYRANLSGAILSEANLGANLSEADLTGANLSEANLSGANLTGADLRGANLRGANLRGLDLSEANLRELDLSEANLSEANLSWANLIRAILSGANLWDADLSGANLSGANLSGANLRGTNLRGTNLSNADLTEADLSQASLVETRLIGANLMGSSIYGISALNLQLEETIQTDLVITPVEEPKITVDNLEVAQFIYLILNNKKIRDVIDMVTSKVVLILGRFTPERKAILETIRKEVRRLKYIPVLFDFDKPENTSFIETVSTLAGMARFIIADLTEARIVLAEVEHIVPRIAVPVILLLKVGEQEPVILNDLRINHRSLLDTVHYIDVDELLTSFDEKVICPVEAKVEELSNIRRKLYLI